MTSRVSLLFLFLSFQWACQPDPVTPMPCGTQDDVLRLHHVQALGTHNSYHLEPESPVDDSHRYSHAPLLVQLDEQGVRQLELDLHLREGQGFEVFHLPVVDQETTCRRFTDCLEEVRRWSEANRCHLPLMIWLEPKDEADALLDPSLEPIEGHYDELEAEVLSVFDLDRLVTPDDLRGAHASLTEAVSERGWPTLGELRGRVIFSMLDSETHREAYLAESPDLSNRLFFVDADGSDDITAATLKINNARSDADSVRALAQAGFVVTSNADGDDGADSIDRAEASLAAGAHYLSTDYPEPDDGGYWLEIPEGTPARCNPITAPSECLPVHIEDLP